MLTLLDFLVATPEEERLGHFVNLLKMQKNGNVGGRVQNFLYCYCFMKCAGFQ